MNLEHGVQLDEGPHDTSAIRTADMGPRASEYAENIHRQIEEIYGRLGVSSSQELRALPVKKLRGRGQDIAQLNELCVQLEKALQKPDVIERAVLDEQMAQNTLDTVDVLAASPRIRTDDQFAIGIGRARIAYIRGEDWRQYLLDVDTSDVRFNRRKSKALAGAYARCGDFTEVDVIVEPHADMGRDPFWICTRIREFVRHDMLDEALAETLHFFSVGRGSEGLPIGDLYAALLQQGRVDDVETLCGAIEAIDDASFRKNVETECIFGVEILIQRDALALAKEAMQQRFIQGVSAYTDVRIHLVEAMKNAGDPESEVFAVQAFDGLIARPFSVLNRFAVLECARTALGAMTPETARQKFSVLEERYRPHLRNVQDRVVTMMLAAFATCAHAIGGDPKPYLQTLGDARRDALAKLAQSGASRTTGTTLPSLDEANAMRAGRNGVDEAVAWAMCGQPDQAVAVARTLHAREGEEYVLPALLDITDALRKSKKPEDVARAKKVLEEAVVEYVNSPLYTRGEKRGAFPKQIVEAKMQFGEKSASALCHFARDMYDGVQEIELYSAIAKHVYAHGGDVQYVMDLANTRTRDVFNNASLTDRGRLLDPFCVAAAAMGFSGALQGMITDSYIRDQAVSSMITTLFDDAEARLLRAKQVLTPERV